MYNDILTTLKSTYYIGDRKNFNFDKYCTAHVEQHNRHASLVEYNVPAEHDDPLLRRRDQRL
jgi:hypothetical protein